MILLVLAWTGPAPAGAPQAQDVPRSLQKPIQVEVSVVLHLVQVYVMDKKGNPIPDLAKSDFVLTDNGQPVNITEFEVRTIAGAGAEAPPVPAAAPPVPAAAVPAPAGGESLAENAGMSRRFVLFFDFAFNNPRGVKKSKEAALHFMDKEVKPGDEVALLSYSLTRGLSINEFLTTDHAKVRQALEIVDLGKAAGRAESLEQEYWLAGFEDRAATGGSASQPSPERSEANLSWRRQESKNQARNFIHKLTGLAEALRYVPGQKHIILFSHGIAGSLMYMHQEIGSTKTPINVGDYVLRTDYEDMLKKLSSANCQIFAFDTRESAKVPSLFDYDEQTFGLTRGAGRFMFTTGGVSQSPDLFFKNEDFTGLYPLTKLAKDTGGIYYGNINEYERNLGRLETMTGAFYVLGYPVNESWDGRFHEITVDVKRKDVKVSAPRGFYNPVPFKDMSALEQEFALFDLALSDRPVLQAPLEAQMTALAAPFGPDMNLGTIIRLPAGTLAELAGPKVEIISFAFDEAENLVDMRRAVHDLSGVGDREIVYASGGLLKPGAYRCRVVARNLDTGRAAVASCRVFVPPPASGGLRLHSILLLQPGSNAAYLEGAGQARRRAGDAATSWADLYTFDRSRFTPAPGAFAAGTDRIFCAVPCSVGGIAEPLIGLRAFLVDMRTGARTAVPVTLHDKVVWGDLFVQSVELGLAGVPPGTYSLYLHADEKSTKTAARIATELVLR
ncbi:MAG TPA: VWA domain-containing protein [Acidobacteriota bacterium]|nr:VWA domain-containing protein [Acidobacteriota bacterium]